MPSECIHGFEEGLCDICFPKAPVVKPRVVSRSQTPQRTSRVAAPKTPPVNLLDQRVYHVTHVRNLAGIVERGAVLAFEQTSRSASASAPDVASNVAPDVGSTVAPDVGSSVAPDMAPTITVDLSSPLARELRTTARLDASAAPSVSAHVPWYLSADASVWQELRRGAAESRWSSAARAAASTDFVVLVSTVRALAALDGFAVADGDAAGTFTTFATDTEQGMRMLARLHNTEQLLDAEVLVLGSVPCAAVQLIGVANEPQRDRVRQVLDAATFPRTKVAVYPPWFAAPE